MDLVTHTDIQAARRAVFGTAAISAIKESIDECMRTSMLHIRLSHEVTYDGSKLRHTQLADQYLFAAEYMRRVLLGE